MCGPNGPYPVCYVPCNADCGDVMPAKGRGRCQSKVACEEHRKNTTAIQGRNSKKVPQFPLTTTTAKPTQKSLLLTSAAVNVWPYK